MQTTVPTPRATTPGFRVLGLLQVRGREPVVVTARRQQVVLALLLLNGNRVVPLAALLDALWGAEPPATARAQVQTCVSALRRALAKAGLGERISARGSGYCLDLAPGELDLHEFEALVARGRAARRPEEARAAFREALALWRGEPLTGIDSAVVRAHQVRIAQRRVEVLEDCLDAELELGLHREVVGEISVLTEEHPLRERFVLQLMTALHRCGRRVEALAAYRAVRRRFVEELGLEPGAALRELHQDILAGSSEAPPHGRAVPRMLPARLPYFTGHERLLAALRRGLTDDGPGAAVVTVLTGRGGVGKSAVAAEAAHRAAPAFPDGVLYARLAEEDAAEVLARFLHALGVPAAEIPDDLDGRAALYRSVLAGRRVLTVLEDAAGLARVTPFVADARGCRLLVTTHARVASRPGLAVAELDVLDGAEGVELLSALVGEDRVTAELSDAVELVELCGGLPLAVTAAATHVAARPGRTLAQEVARLRAEDDRLGRLGAGVRAAVGRGLDELPAPARELFARLALLPPGSWAGWAAAALGSADALESLVDARLVDVAGARYRLPSLTRLLAAEMLAGQPLRAPSRRLFGAWLQVTDEVRGVAAGSAPRTPVSAELGDVSTWYDRESAGLLAAVRQAAAAGEPEYCAELALAVADLAGARGRYADWRESGETALRAVVSAGDRRVEAALERSLGELAVRESRFADAAGRITRALTAGEQAGGMSWDELVRQVLAGVDRARAAVVAGSGVPGFSPREPGPGNHAAAPRIAVGRNQYELAADRAPGDAARSTGRAGHRRLPRPRPISWRRESEYPEEA
ncbi:DNA-binding transcriptional activator of the SARP family [Amycolatopsis tolypomycina]|uniref:DNA-binding transcriptional activator of the SARP family n=1 Tax=Amycolatopsis tolypomycina TaxID=208445 RepID=A0A1H4TQZ2_9PSEU|nr:AfsR/SARP family transcriptional regulator [Amycolatopsis tolypomycina]SEC58916.1 DNA-binding transcriptional activator of the SARP family [Amycolatopsis tolypomycina]